MGTRSGDVDPGLHAYLAREAGLSLGEIDTLLIAGGSGQAAACEDGELIDWIASASAHARRTASVCTGAFLLARAGGLCRRDRVGRQGRGDLGRNGEQDGRAFRRDQEAGDARQAGRAIAVAREARRHAHREQEAEVAEDRRTCGRQKGDVEKVGLTDAKQ